MIDDVTSAQRVTTVTFCGYAPSERFWAFNQMGSSRRALARTAGLRFWKLLGTGQGLGFTLRPDFSRYGLLAVWEQADAAERFHAHSSLMAAYRRHAREVWTVRLRTTRAHGAWSGANPFLPAAPADDDRPTVVLTRASLRLRTLRAFWRAVPAATVPLEQAPGLLASIGTGEAPFIRPATFSIWRTTADLEAYAYGTEDHRTVIRRRQDEGWYREELFARFTPIASEGSWNGRDPLAGLL